MSRALLEKAQDLILRQAYDEAREILESLQERSSTARRWLANLNELEAEQEAAEAQQLETVDDTTMVLAEEPTLKASSATEQPTAASGEYQAFAETYQHDARQQWEYREIVLANWNQHMDNIQYALEQGGSEKITVEDAYVRLLNENGAQGWEVIAEEILPQQHIRLLMKRPVM
jgi:hypothetical protein